jgi:hypothetical protein
MRHYRTPSTDIIGRIDVRWQCMAPQTDSPTQLQTRHFPGWVRAVVWLSAAFLTMSVIAGMFLY